MPEYPIPVEDFTGVQALTIVCESCDAEGVITADEIYNEDMYTCPADTERARRGLTELRCNGVACMKYALAPKCENCGRLGWDFMSQNYCSRLCQLQGEWAAAIAAREASGSANPKATA